LRRRWHGARSIGGPCSPPGRRPPDGRRPEKRGTKPEHRQ
jgi:hypothetical protein